MTVTSSCPCTCHSISHPRKVKCFCKCGKACGIQEEIAKDCDKCSEGIESVEDLCYDIAPFCEGTHHSAAEDADWEKELKKRFSINTGDEKDVFSFIKHRVEQARKLEKRRIKRIIKQFLIDYPRNENRIVVFAAGAGILNKIR